MEYKKYSKEIEAYCNENKLSFSKLAQMVRGCGDNDIIFQKYNSLKTQSGLLDETPMPVVLRVMRKSGSLVFEQTEYTRKYLS